MKALILSCNTGQGHNAAGKAILENLTQRGIVCEMADALAFAGEKVSKVTSDTYVKIATASPSVFHFFLLSKKLCFAEGFLSLLQSMLIFRYTSPPFKWRLMPPSNIQD